jgi:hypothetical protein
MQRLAPANQVWSRASKSVGETFSGVSALEQKVNQTFRDHRKQSASKFADSFDRSSENRGPDGPDSSSASLDELFDSVEKMFDESITMVGFSITAEVMSKTSSETIGDLKHLESGGAG